MASASKRLLGNRCSNKFVTAGGRSTDTLWSSLRMTGDGALCSFHCVGLGSQSAPSPAATHRSSLYVVPSALY